MGKDAIKVNYLSIDEAINTLTNLISSCDEAIASIKETNFYKGNKSKGYAANAVKDLTSHELVDSVSELKNLISATKNLLEKSKDKFDSTDKNLANKINK